MEEEVEECYDVTGLGYYSTEFNKDIGDVLAYEDYFGARHILMLSPDTD